MTPAPPPSRDCGISRVALARPVSIFGPLPTIRGFFAARRPERVRKMRPTGWVEARPAWPRLRHAASSIAASSPSAPSDFAPRRCAFFNCASITFKASISLSFCTAAISLIIRSSAAS